MLYRKLKKTWSYNTCCYIPNFKETFPELSKLPSDELEKRFRELGANFYTEKQTPVKAWIRITLPFALILMLLMFISIPFKFIITGTWNFDLGDKNYIYNWFKQLRLL